MIAVGADRSSWIVGGGIAFAGHAVVLAAVLLIGVTPPRAVVEDPVVLVELPPQAGPAPAALAQPEPLRPDAPLSEAVDQRVEAPLVRAPLPQEFVATPPPPPAPARRTPTPAAAASPQPPRAAAALVAAGSGTGTAETAGDDPKAKREEADYFALLSAHLNRKKQYPKEAKKAREEGVVTVRFTVHADGTISAASIRKSSGHSLLDQATLELMERVAPLPKFPKSMTKSSVTISLPIDYSLRTS